MKHLTPETLARLVDEAPTPEEEAILREDPAAAAELRALKEMRTALAGLPALRPPVGDWEGLEGRLGEEGLLRAGGGGSRSPFIPSTFGGIAAGLLLFVLGAGTGSAFSHREGPEGAGAEPAGGVAALLQAAETAATVEEAEEAVRMAERPYLSALARYHELSESSRRSPAVDPATRVAALEAILAASQAAVRKAPGDPFLNGILMSTSAEREAVLQRLPPRPRDHWF